jgi:hypothetical protein
MCRNNKGEIRHILTQIGPPFSQVNGEALAAKLATELAFSMQLNQFILEGESSTVIAALNSVIPSLDSTFDHFIKDILLSFSDSSLWEATKSPEMKISTPIMWFIGPRQAAFPPYSPPPPSSIPICSGKDPPPCTPH